MDSTVNPSERRYSLAALHKIGSTIIEARLNPCTSLNSVDLSDRFKTSHTPENILRWDVYLWLSIPLQGTAATMRGNK